MIKSKCYFICTRTSMELHPVKCSRHRGHWPSQFGLTYQYKWAQRVAMYGSHCNLKTFRFPFNRCYAPVQTNNFPCGEDLSLGDMVIHIITSVGSCFTAMDWKIWWGGDVLPLYSQWMVAALHCSSMISKAGWGKDSFIRSFFFKWGTAKNRKRLPIAFTVCSLGRSRTWMPWLPVPSSRRRRRKQKKKGRCYLHGSGPDPVVIPNTPFSFSAIFPHSFCSCFPSLPCHAWSSALQHLTMDVRTEAWVVSQVASWLSAFIIWSFPISQFNSNIFWCKCFCWTDDNWSQNDGEMTPWQIYFSPLLWAALSTISDSSWVFFFVFGAFIQRVICGWFLMHVGKEVSLLLIVLTQGKRQAGLAPLLGHRAMKHQLAESFFATQLLETPTWVWMWQL